MEKVVRISTTATHEKTRIDDIQKIPPNERVLLLLKMQRKFYGWDTNNKIKRIATIRRIAQ